MWHLHPSNDVEINDVEINDVEIVACQNNDYDFRPQ
jgi:hypothetical protein